jgi:hypothetical protein
MGVLDLNDFSSRPSLIAAVYGAANVKVDAELFVCGGLRTTLARQNSTIYCDTAG